MRMHSLLALAVALAAAHAGAEPRAAHLLGDAPRLALGVAPRLLDGALGAAEVKKETPAALEGIGFAEHFTKGAAIGVGSTVVGALLGAGLGALSNHLIVSVLAVGLSNLFLPPLLTVLLAQLVGNWDSPGRFGFWLPLAGAFAVNAALYLVTSFVLAVPWTNVAALLLYSLADGVLMSGASVGLMHLTQKKKEAPATVTSFVPGVADTTLVPLVKVAL